MITRKGAHTWFAGILYSILLLLGSTQNAFSALITNGGFETGDFTAWSVSGSVSVGDSSNNICCASSEGTYRANFSVLAGQLSQTFATIVGTAYFLDFDFAKGGTGSGSADLNIQVTGLNTLLNEAISDSTGGQPGPYSSFSYIFIADDANATLIFANISTETEDFDVLLDAVSVSAVPLPAAAWLFGSGLIGLLGVAKRKH